MGLPFRSLVGSTMVAILVAVGIVAVAPAQPVEALDGSAFDPGYIISDAQFYDAGAMTQPQIQSFLDQNIGACTNGLCLNVLRATTFDRPADRTVCGAYAGASNELTSEIIYKIQATCGISAKVLLVTLQKEQSLVSGSISRAPSATRIGRAMGYACPDNTGGVCDARYNGIYNQLYMAAWQFKRYSTPDLWGNFRPGAAVIAYNPTASCGSRSVNIRNHATAALYNYTPYTPNDAALANLYGTSDCGAYGNRNFWVFYNTWFGDPTGSSAAFEMDELYRINGGATGAFGALVTASVCSAASTTCWRDYRSAVVSWNKSSGAVAVTGTILARYRSAGSYSGTLGLPSTGTLTYPSLPGRTAQSFGTASTIYSSAAGTFLVKGEVRRAFFNVNGEGGTLGWPTAEESCGAGRCSQPFERGVVYSASPGTFAVPQAINAVYTAAGGQTGDFGSPSTSVFISASQPDRMAQSFSGGASVYTSSRGAFTVRGLTRTAFFRAGGESGPLGWPVSAATCVNASCTQSFEGGAVYSDARSATSVAAPIYATYAAAGGPTGSMGLPTSAVISYPLPGRVAQSFAGGTIYASPAGSFVVRGAVRSAYFAAGGESGSLGWPIAAEVCAGAECSQAFERGTVS